MKSSILQIKTSSSYVNPVTPWAVGSQDLSATAFVISHEGEKVLLTNAHCVKNARYITVKFPDNTDLYQAEIVSFSPEVDLALLKCSDAAFQAIAEPLTFADKLPRQDETIQAHGFPNGCDYSVTKGAVIRYDVSIYALLRNRILKFTIDALLKPGNSGGPLTIDREVDGEVQKLVVGVNHQVENEGGFGAAIPLPVILRFLENPKFPELIIRTQPMNNPVLREHFGLPANKGGILVMPPIYERANVDSLNPHDIILAVDGRPLNVEGKIYNDEVGTSIDYTYYVMMHHPGDEVSLKIFRAKKEMDLVIKLTTTIGELDLIRFNFDQDEQNYLCINGLVITPLSLNYTSYYQSRDTPTSAAIRNLISKVQAKTPKQSKAFIISKILPCQSTQELSGYVGAVISTINGQPIGSMCELINAFKTETKIHVIITTTDVVIAVRNLSEADNEILLKRYSVPSKWPEHVEEKYKQHQIRRLERSRFFSTSESASSSTEAGTSTEIAITGRRPHEGEDHPDTPTTRPRFDEEETTISPAA